MHSQTPELDKTALIPTYVPTVETELPVKQQIIDEVACNCYLAVKQRIPNLPLTKNLIPNSEVAVGSVAIFKYPSGLMHYAYVESFGTEVFKVSESNYLPCQRGERLVNLNDKSLLGFYAI